MVWSGFRLADIRAVAALSARERRLLAQAVVVLPITGLLVKRAGYRRLHDTLSRVVPVAPIPADPLGEATTISRLVSLAADRGPLPATCLSRSLALWLLLRRHGVEADVCLGLRGGGAQPHGHAWVEYQGRPLNETVDVRNRFLVMNANAPGPKL
jgi:hypothetical protein